MSLEVSALPYPLNALEPHVSAQTLELHHGKHYRGYVEKTRNLIAGTVLANRTLEDIISMAAPRKSRTALFNNAAQAWNHEFYWNCMSPGGGGEPHGALADQIRKDFGSYAQFADAFRTAATGHFGSGWVWLVAGGRKLAIVATSNADTPVAHGKVPLLTIDVWEHAYYLDYQNRRAEYAAGFMKALVNWEFAEARFRRVGRLEAAE